MFVCNCLSFPLLTSIASTNNNVLTKIMAFILYNPKTFLISVKHKARHAAVVSIHDKQSILLYFTSLVPLKFVSFSVLLIFLLSLCCSRATLRAVTMGAVKLEIMAPTV